MIYFEAGSERNPKVFTTPMVRGVRWYPVNEYHTATQITARGKHKFDNSLSLLGTFIIANVGWWIINYLRIVSVVRADRVSSLVAEDKSCKSKRMTLT